MTLISTQSARYTCRIVTAIAINTELHGAPASGSRVRMDGRTDLHTDRPWRSNGSLFATLGMRILFCHRLGVQQFQSTTMYTHRHHAHVGSLLSSLNKGMKAKKELQFLMTKQWSMRNRTSDCSSKVHFCLFIWPWSWKFTVEHTIYVRCEYFMNQEGYH